MIEIRKADIGDIPFIEKELLYICAYHRAGRPDIFIDGGIKYGEGELADIIGKDTVLVAETDGVRCGYLIALLNEYSGERATRKMKTLYVDDLCVDEAYRGAGAGKALMEAAFAEAKTLGCYNVTLNVWEFGGSALGFYESLGMSVMSRKMEKIL